MKRILPIALLLCLLSACEAPPEIRYPTEVPIVLVERRWLPIGDAMLLGMSDFQDGKALVEIYTGDDDESVFGPVIVKPGDVHPFEVGDRTYYLVVHEVGYISRERIADEFGLNVGNIPIGREFGMERLSPS